MSFLRIATALGLSSVLWLAASPAHAIAYPGPTAKQLKTLEKQVTARIARSAIYKQTVAGGGKLKLSFTPGQPTTGPDRSHVQPTINALLLGKKGAMGMANNHSRVYGVTEGASGKYTARAEGKWVQLMTVTKPQ